MHTMNVHSLSQKFDVNILKIKIPFKTNLMIANFKFATENRYVEGNQHAMKTPDGDKSAFQN